MILPLLHPIERALAASALLPHDGVVVVAVSGGADSMALVEALRRTWATPGRSDAISAARYPMSRARTMSGGASPESPATLLVAHFDHRLRDDSARDAEHVAAYARSHALEFVLGSEDVARRARTRRTSIEEAGRDARYEFLSKVAGRLGAIRVATAHTRSDQVETILMRVLRGTGRVGVAGIPAQRGIIVRPLLDVTRAQTRGYCETRGVAFVDDESNEDVRFLRNRVRHEILPQLREAFPSIDDALLRLAETAVREERAFTNRTDGWLRDHLREEAPGVWALSLVGFDACDDEDATALLRDSLARVGLARDVGRVHYRRLLGLVRSSNAGSSADLPGFSARREHDALVIQKRERADAIDPSTRLPQRVALTTRPAAGVARGAPAAPGGGVTSDRTRGEGLVILAVPGRTHAGEWIVDADFVSLDDARVALTRGTEPDVAYFDADALSTRLVARSIREGDRMRPFGLGGQKKLSDLFVDRKIPRRHRARAIVIEGEAIHWVPGLATSDAGRVGPATARVVRLKASRE